MAELLKINNLIVGFENPQGELTAVKGVSLALDKGETLALVGESGCGKTVLCKSMLKILCEKGRIRQGEILLEGKNLIPVTEREMTALRGGDIAMVFQDPMTSLDPAFSVGEQIAEVLRIHKKLSKEDAKAQAIKLMEMVKIPDAELRYDQRPYQFSGGMRQRIVIAIALAGEPELLLADEPTTALDEETQEEILKLLKEVRRQTKVAVLFITHDLSLVEDIADRVAIMKDGQVVEQGDVKEVFAAPQHEYTKKLLGYLDYKKGTGHNHAASISREAEPVVTVKNLSKSFAVGKNNVNHVLNDFSMEIYRGEILGMTGKSGCGKSTLARCIMGLEKPNEGNVWIKEGLRTQMIFQDSQASFNERMTVEQIIAEPLRINMKANTKKNGKDNGRRYNSADIKEAVTTSMSKVELDSQFASRKPYELSGGQRQRVAIARALITEPDFIIADEPLTGLDVSAQAQITHLLKKLADEQNLTILFIAHDIPMVKHISSRIIQM